MIAVGVLVSCMAGLPGGPLLHGHLPNVLETARVGEWVTYRLDAGAGREYFWRVAVVGEQTDRHGRPAVWVELDLGTHPAMKAPIVQLKVLASRGQGMSPAGVTRMFAAFGVERPREVEPDDLPKMLGSGEKQPAGSGVARAGVRVTRAQPTRLMTVGGAVWATPIEVRLRDTLLKRLWVSDAIPILRLAKIDFPAVQHAMEVRDWGLDAKPQVQPPEASAATIRMEGPK